MDFAKTLEHLMQRNGITKYRLSKTVGCSATTVTNWLNGTAPTGEYLQKLSDIFGVSIDYLLGNSQKEKPVTDSDGFTEAERRDIALELEKLMEEMTRNGDLMFDGEPATKEAMDSLRSAMEMGLIYAKKINKEKLNQ